MKYLIYTILFCLIFPNLNTFAYASDNVFHTYYAKVMKDNVYFYSTPDESSPLFEIPNTYFVLLTDSANANFYKACYADKSGYVKKDEVTAMNGSPQNAYATTFNIRITSMSGLSLQDHPSFDSTPITNLNFLETNITYYGKLSGQEYFPNSTKTWYYCSYNHNNKQSFGYLFSYYCDLPKAISTNQEYFEEITETLVFKTTASHKQGLPDSLKALIILSVIIPVLICIYFFMMPKKVKNKKIIHRKKDYYELNENDLN